MIDSRREIGETDRLPRVLLGSLGVILLLGGIGHSAGVIRFYIVNGVPEANRVLLDVWVAEAHLVGGGFYLAAFRSMRRGGCWRGLAIAGAVTTLTYLVPFIPVLFDRAPPMFRVPPIVYAIMSVCIVIGVATSSTRPHHDIVAEEAVWRQHAAGSASRRD